MTVSRIPQAIDALLAIWRSAELTVWDGPVVTGDFTDSIFVGYDGDPDGDFLASAATQEWRGLGAHHKSETGPITCAAVALNGDGDVKAARDKVYAMATTADDAIRPAPSLGLSTPFVARLTTGQLYIEPTEAGLQARLLLFVNIDIARV